MIYHCCPAFFERRITFSGSSPKPFLLFLICLSHYRNVNALKTSFCAKCTYYLDRIHRDNFDVIHRYNSNKEQNSFTQRNTPHGFPRFNFLIINKIMWNQWKIHKCKPFIVLYTMPYNVTLIFITHTGYTKYTP